MSVKTEHDTGRSIWFVTFTCFQWRHFFELTKSYDLVYNWFLHLREKKIADVMAYVIVPNHVHLILDLASEQKSLNTIVGNGKRFIAYDIIDRLKERGEVEILKQFEEAVSSREKVKGRKHKAFEEPFDAKAIYTRKFLLQKIDYIHHNPVKGKWSLVEDFTDYEHSSASFYELDVVKHFEPKHYVSIL